MFVMGTPICVWTADSMTGWVGRTCSPILPAHPAASQTSSAQNATPTLSRVCAPFFTFPCFISSLFCERFSCSPGWPLNAYVADDELLIPLLQLWSLRLQVCGTTPASYSAGVLHAGQEHCQLSYSMPRCSHLTRQNCTL